MATYGGAMVFQVWVGGDIRCHFWSKYFFEICHRRCAPLLWAMHVNFPVEEPFFPRLLHRRLLTINRTRATHEVVALCRRMKNLCEVRCPSPKQTLSYFVTAVVFHLSPPPYEDVNITYRLHLCGYVYVLLLYLKLGLRPPDFPNILHVTYLTSCRGRLKDSPRES